MLSIFRSLVREIARVGTTRLTKCEQSCCRYYVFRMLSIFRSLQIRKFARAEADRIEKRWSETRFLFGTEIFFNRIGRFSEPRVVEYYIGFHLFSSLLIISSPRFCVFSEVQWRESADGSNRASFVHSLTISKFKSKRYVSTYHWRYLLYVRSYRPTLSIFIGSITDIQSRNFGCSLHS